MKKRIGVLVIVEILIFSLISFASAEIFLSTQPEEIYNLGDILDISLGSDGTPGWANVNLVCGNSSKMVFFNYLTEDKTSVDINVPITKSFLRGLKGECYLSMVLGEAVKESLTFEISDHLELNVVFDKTEFDPNETVYFSGSSTKENLDLVNGFVQIKFPSTGLETIIPIQEGKFNGNISLPANMPSGNHIVDIFAYEKDGEEISNFGSFVRNITVKQKPKNLVINVGEDIDPGADLEFSARLTDQADSDIIGIPVGFTLVNSKGDEVLNVLGKTGESVYYKLNKNAPYGTWNLSAEAERLVSEIYPIYVKQNKEAEFVLINNTLVIRNIGNVAYDRLVEIDIGGNHTELENLNLSIGRSVEFELYAPNGNYTIDISDGVKDISGVAALTGEAISIKTARRGVVGIFSKNLFIWSFVILIFGLFIFISARRVINTRYTGRSTDFSKKGLRGLFGKNAKKEEKGGVVHVTPYENGKKAGISLDGEEATHLPVLQGQKQMASVLALKIKNKDEVLSSGTNAQSVIDNVENLISSNNGRVYKTNEYIIGIFAPVVTKTFGNSFTTAKVANSIANILKDYNKKYTQKIRFGIGLNEGDIIAKKEGNKFMFTSLGAGVSNAKKIADIAENDYLLSEGVNRSIKSKIKSVANPERFDIKTYSVIEFLDRSRQQEFIRGFLDRNPDYKQQNRDFKRLNNFKV